MGTLYDAGKALLTTDEGLSGMRPANRGDLINWGSNLTGPAARGAGKLLGAGTKLFGKSAPKLIPVAERRTGADLIASRPSILSDPSLSANQLTYLQKAFARKELSIQRTANRGELVYTPGTDGFRIESLQRSYRSAVATRYERMYGRPIDLSTFNADHTVDLIIGGSPEQSLRLLNQSINKSVGASLLQAGRRAGLQPGDSINSVKFR